MDNREPIYDAMSLAVLGEMWRGSTALHEDSLQQAWNSAWDALGNVSFPSEHWDDTMRRVHAEQIAQYDALSKQELMALFKLMTYKSGVPFYCAVLALANKLRVERHAEFEKHIWTPPKTKGDHA